MKTNHRRMQYHLLLMTALLHLFADVAFAGGAILCVGPDDHLAIEAEHASVAGCQAADDTEEARDTDLDLASSVPGCSDTPLHSEAELLDSANPASGLTPNAVAHSGHFHVLDLAFRGRGFTIERATGSSPSLRAHGTTVLIL